MKNTGLTVLYKSIWYYTFDCGLIGRYVGTVINLFMISYLLYINDHHLDSFSYPSYECIYSVYTVNICIYSFYPNLYRPLSQSCLHGLFPSAVHFARFWRLGLVTLSHSMGLVYINFYYFDQNSVWMYWKQHIRTFSWHLLVRYYCSSLVWGRLSHTPGTAMSGRGGCSPAAPVDEPPLSSTMDKCFFHS